MAGSATSPRKPRRPALLVALLVPALGHFGLVIAGVAGSSAAKKWDILDWSINGVVLTYLLLAVALWVKGSSAAAKIALLAYTGIVVLALCELTLAMMAPAWPPYRVPWPPKLQRVSTAADTMPGIEGEIRFTTNALGLRGPDFGKQEQWDARILCVGGSTTECLYVTDEKSWPWLLQNQLAEKTGKRVFVGNAGRSGHIAAHHAYLLNNYEFAGRFEYVVVLCGLNDLGMLMKGDTDKRMARIHETTLVHPSGYDLKPIYYHQAQLGMRADQILRRLVPDKGTAEQDEQGRWYTDVRKKRAEALSKNKIAVPHPGLADGLNRYESALLDIIAVCRKRGQKLTMCTQPAMWRDGLTDEQQAMLWAATDDGAYTPRALQQMLDAYNDRLKEVCARENVAVVDLDAIVAKDETAFYDDCHFNTPGCAQVAAALADHLAPRMK
ncbi:MAG: SGNH/GDSL hydrolase family protein [Planctomycetes bacterium]|nr:SGNH/GDSL hydrolase family protein [Planctomycetota bacterium]